MLPQIDSQTILTELNQLGQKYSMSHWGFSKLEKPLSFEFYRAWIEAGAHGDMTYLQEHLPLKENPQNFWPKAKSALVFAVAYAPFPEKHKKVPLPSLRRAQYSQGEDYHFWFKSELQKIQDELASQFKDAHFLSLTDSSPVLERDLAARAGLGWFGKNTCLIHPKKGSLFLIGEIYTDLEFQEQLQALPDFCGTCTKCIDICPTQALEKPRYLNAEKCISYWTIESRKIPPPEIRAKFGDWFFGCDLCQTTCPWNQKVFQKQLNTELILSDFSRPELCGDLKFILTSSGKQLQRTFKNTALLRAGPFGLRRNALILVGNRQLKELEPEVQAYLQDSKLRELAEWTLRSIQS